MTLDERWSDAAEELRGGLRAVLAEEASPEAVRRMEESQDTAGLEAALADFGLHDLPADPELLAAAAWELGVKLAPTTWVATQPTRALFGLMDVADGTAFHIPAGIQHAVVVGADGRPRLTAAQGPRARSAAGDTVVAPGPPRPTDDAVGTEQDAQALDRLGMLLHAARLAGAARGLVDLAVGYAGVREQFGQPIGAFQAVAFRLVDAAIAVDAGQLLIQRAAAAATDAGGVAPPAPFAQMAWNRVCRSAEEVATSAHQVMGGYGFATEFDCQLYSRRIRTWTRRRSRASVAAYAVGALLLDASQRDAVAGLWHHDRGMALPRWARELETI